MDKKWSKFSNVEVESLKVGDKEITPEMLGGIPPVMGKLANMKPLNIRGEVTTLEVAKAFNALITELKVNGYMDQK